MRAVKEEDDVSLVGRSDVVVVKQEEDTNVDEKAEAGAGQQWVQ